MATNLPSVTVGQFVHIIETQFNEGLRRPIFGLGKGGIGKTESIMDLAKNKLNIGYVDIRLLLYAETDLKGIPYPDKDGASTIWLQNDILPIADRDGEKGILVLDEITSCSRSVRTAAYQLLNERKLGQYELPDGWMIVCLGNGEDDGGDFQGMEGNFANRCSIFNVIPNVDSWKDWAYSKNVNYLVLAYISWQPQMLHTFDPNNESDILFASPRSWKAVSDILNVHPYNDKDDITNLRIISNVGTLAGQQFISFCKYKESAVDPADIIDGKKVPNITSMEVLYMTIQGVIKLMSGAIKTDLANTGTVSDNALIKCANAFRWIFTLNALEHQIMAIKDFIATDRAITAKWIILNKRFNTLCPELMEFTTKHCSVITLNSK